MDKKTLLLDCLRGLLLFKDRFGQVPQVWAQWLCERLSWHKVLPLAAAINDPCKPKCLILNDIFHKTTLRNMVREEHYRRQVQVLFDALENGAIEYIPFKGPFWFTQLYDAYHWRHIGDIDLLLPKNHIRKAAAIMIEIGYTPHVLEGSLTKDLAIRGEVAFFPDSSHPNNVPVELHWDPMPSPRFMRKQYLLNSDFVRQTTLCQWQGLSYALPPPEIQFLYFVLHATCQHQFLRFVHVLTLVHFIQKHLHMNWQQLFELAKARDACTPLYYGLSFADSFWDLPKPVRELKEQLKIPLRSRIAAACLQPNRIAFSTDKDGAILRKLFRVAMSW